MKPGTWGSGCWYDVLGVSRHSSTSDVKKAFRSLALRHHPDKGGDAEAFKRLTAAWEVLGNKGKRLEYNQVLQKTGSLDGVRFGVGQQQRGSASSSAPVPKPSSGRGASFSSEPSASFHSGGSLNRHYQQSATVPNNRPNASASASNNYEQSQGNSTSNSATDRREASATQKPRYSSPYVDFERNNSGSNGSHKTATAASPPARSNVTNSAAARKENGIGSFAGATDAKRSSCKESWSAGTAAGGNCDSTKAHAKDFFSGSTASYSHSKPENSASAERQRNPCDANTTPSTFPDPRDAGSSQQDEEKTAPAKARTASGSAGNCGSQAHSAAELPTTKQARAMSVKDIKELLQRLKVRHDHCLERSDLVSLVVGVLEEQRSSREPGPSAGRGAKAENGTRGSAFQSPTSNNNSAARSSFSATTSAAPPPPSSSTPSSTSTSSSAGSNDFVTAVPLPLEKRKPLRMKVVSLGSPRTGKSCLIKRYCEGRFVNQYISTIGIDYGVKQVSASDYGCRIKVNFFDLSGLREFADIRAAFYADVQAAILVFDVTSRDTFEALGGWVQEARKHGMLLSRPQQVNAYSSPPFVVLLGNKTDLDGREVSTAEATAFAAEHGMDFFETSANSGECVQEAFNKLFSRTTECLLRAKKKAGEPSRK